MAALDYELLGLEDVFLDYAGRLAPPDPVHRTLAALTCGSVLRMDIHGGEVETSLMLHLVPHLVRRDRLENFPYSDERRARNDTLNYDRPAGLGWMSEDLNPQGVVGNAAGADAERGRIYLEFLGARLAAVCDEMLR